MEEKYGISLASAIMRVMVKEVPIVDLPKFFVFEFGLDGRKAEELVEELKEQVFIGVADYLGFIVGENRVAANKDQFDQWSKNKKAEADVQGSSFFFSPEDEEEVRELAKRLETITPPKEETKKEENVLEQKIDQICKQLKVSFSSTELNDRFRKIINTYIKGVRNKVDTKISLTKSIDAGGVSLDPIYVDNILLVADKINSDFVPSIKTDKKNDLQKLQSNGVRDFDYDFSSLAKKPIEKKNNDIKNNNLHFVDENSNSKKDIPTTLTKNKEPLEKDELIDLTKIDYKNDNQEISLSKSGEKVKIKSEITSVPTNIARARRIAEEEKPKRISIKSKEPTK
jgi:hypothetical protein